MANVKVVLKVWNAELLLDLLMVFETAELLEFEKFDVRVEYLESELGLKKAVL
jgi:hypothetical protein